MSGPVETNYQAAPTKPQGTWGSNEYDYEQEREREDHHHHHHHHRRGGRSGWRYRFGRGFGRRGRITYGDGRGRISCAGCMFILCIVFGSILGTIGFAFVASSKQDTRKDRIEAYNDYALTWKDFVRNKKYSDPPQVTLETAVICNNSPGGAVNYTVPLSEVATDVFTDKSAIKDGADPLDPQYKWRTDLTFKNIQPENCNVQARIFSNTRLTSTFNQRFANQLTYQCRWKTRDDQDKAYRDCKRRCVNNFGGTFYGETCTYYENLQELCIKVKDEHWTTKPLDSLVVDTSYPVVPDSANSIGCFYSVTDGKFNAGRYKTGQPNYGNINLQTTVRYSKDAYLGYMRVTEGSGDFGMSSEKKLGIGIGLLVPCAFFLLMASWIWKKNRA